MGAARTGGTHPDRREGIDKRCGAIDGAVAGRGGPGPCTTRAQW